MAATPNTYFIIQSDVDYNFFLHSLISIIDSEENWVVKNDIIQFIPPFICLRKLKPEEDI